MKTISLSEDMVHTGNLILVNKEYPLCKGFCEKRLMPVSEINSEVLLEQRTAAVLLKLLDDINCGEEIIPVSGFRSEYEQFRIYQNSLLDNGVEFTQKYVMLPNHSEHQSGLAIDLALNQSDIDFLRPYFPYRGICASFRGKALWYGFIERYPKGKEHITGIAHEPWHFRYIGAPHSKIMWEMGVTLEEYLSRLKEFRYGRKPFRYAFDGTDIEIFFLAAGGRETTFEIEDDLPHTVSGNNVDGFIVTVWRTGR